jgi:hypothetical protein
MATVLEECVTEDQRCMMVFSFWWKRTQCKAIHIKNIFCYGVKCLSHKAVHNWIEKFSEGLSNIADETPPGAEVVETTDKTSMLRVSTHWQSDGTSVSVLVENMWRNNYFSHILISRVLRVLYLSFSLVRVKCTRGMFGCGLLEWQCSSFG